MAENYKVWDNIVGSRDMTAEEKAQRIKDVDEWNSDAKKLKRIKNIRQRKLQETDWWVLRGEITDEQKAWRKSLQDIPTTYSAIDYDALLEVEGEVGNKSLKHSIWSKP